jgi:hypothetical protein
MVVPTVIELEILKNTYRDGIFTQTVPLVVDSDTEIIVGAVHKEDFKQVLWQFTNDGANGLDFQFYAAAVDDLSHGTNKPFSPPPDYDGTTTTWFAVPNGGASVDTIDSDSRIITDNWTWVMITVKRTTSGQDTSGFLQIRGE